MIHYFVHFSLGLSGCVHHLRVDFPIQHFGPKQGLCDSLPVVNVMNFTIAILPLGISFFGQVSTDNLGEALYLCDMSIHNLHGPGAPPVFSPHNKVNHRGVVLRDALDWVRSDNISPVLTLGDILKPR